MISPATIQQVKDAMRVEDVVGEFVALKRKGPRYLGLCPFHNEKTPSFNVSPQLGIFKCFGCGEAGDAITFLQKHEHLSYVEAIRWLAKRYGIEVQEEEATPEQQLEQSERESLAVIQQWAMEWTEHQLWESEEGRRVGLAYFHERGFTDHTIRTFRLGYVPAAGNAFAQAALAHGFLPELLEKAGWIKRRDDAARTPWDFFAGRVTFPVLGLTGQPIAFGARTLREDKKLPKYFNSPESLLYVKSRSLYGIHHAKKAIAEQGVCYLVEGYTDVISLHQAGIHNVVASSGTSLTEDQVRLIKRYAPTVTILYDGDPAGMKASLRGIDLVLKEGLNVKVVTFPDGEDPDSFASKRGHTEVVAYLHDKAQDFLAFKTALLTTGTEHDPVQRAAAIHDIVESLALVPDLVLRTLYIQQCSHMLGVGEQALITEVNKVVRKRYRKQTGEEAPPDPEPTVAPQQQAQVEPVTGTTTQERDLLRMLLRYGGERITVPVTQDDGSVGHEEVPLAEVMFELLASDGTEFTDPLSWAVYVDYRQRHNLGEQVSAADYTGHENPQWRDLAIDLLAEKHELSPNWLERHRIPVKHESEQLYDALIEAVDLLKERRVDRMVSEQEERLRSSDPAEVKAAMEEILRLQVIKKMFAKRTGRVVVR
jgi:DNA primase